MSGFNLSLHTTEMAVPLLANPEHHESLIVVAQHVALAVRDLGILEYALADRFDCSYDKYEVPLLGFKYGSTWEKIDEEYRKACMTQPREFYMHFGLADEGQVAGSYVLPLAAMGKERKAVIASYLYEGRDSKTPHGKTIHKLGKKAIDKPHVEANPFYVPPPTPEEGSPVGRTSSARIFNNALHGGRATARRF